MLYVQKISHRACLSARLSLLLALVAWVLLWRRWRRLGLGFLALAIGWVGVWSLPSPPMRCG